MFQSVAFILFSLSILTKSKTISAIDDHEPSVLKEINYRLPSSVAPINYSIDLTTHLDVNNEKKFTFDGNAKIFLEVIDDTDNITIHTDGLKFKKKDVNIRDEKDQEINQLDITYEAITNFTIIKAESKFARGKKYSLMFKSYSGSLINDELRGFYRSSYTNKIGKKV